jgi:hypothetical protein
MKGSLINNSLILYGLSNNIDTANPTILRFKPCGKYIIGMLIISSADISFSLAQSGKTLFPANGNNLFSNVTNYFRVYDVAGTGAKKVELTDLFIPVSPDYDIDLRISVVAPGTTFNIIVTMASED